MGERTNALVVAAVAGLAIGANAPAQEAANAGQPAGVKCYGINGCAANASCSVKGDDLAAVKTLLGAKAFRSRFGKSALGDCALVPDLSTGRFCPPTAQHALRQGKVVAHNILAHLDGGAFKNFDFKTIGQLATIGHRAGVASIFGANVSGFLAWWMWRTIYLSKLPRLEKKVRVALDWTLDLLFSKDLCQFIDVRQEHKMSKDAVGHLQEPARRVEAGSEQPLAASAAL